MKFYSNINGKKIHIFSFNKKNKKYEKYKLKNRRNKKKIIDNRVKYLNDSP